MPSEPPELRLGRTDQVHGVRGVWGGKRPILWCGLATVALLLGSGAYVLGKPAAVEASGDSTVQQVANAQDAAVADLEAKAEWVVTHSKDPMTDLEIIKATTIVQGDDFDAEIGVTCDSSGAISYEIASFDKSQNPAELRTQARLIGLNRVDVVEYQIRGDHAEPLTLSMYQPRYSNEIVLSADAVKYPSEQIGFAEQISRAQNVRLRLFLPSRQETFQWSQQGPEISQALQPCLSMREAQRSQLNDAKQAEDAALRQKSVEYVDRLYEDPSVEPDELRWRASNRGIPVDEARLAAKVEREKPKKISLP